jgi:hypothetical protein
MRRSARPGTISVPADRQLSGLFAAGGGSASDLAVAVEVVIVAAWIGSLQAALLTADHVRRASWWPLMVLLGIGGGVAIGSTYPLPLLGGAGTFGLVCGLVTATAICWLLPAAAPAGTGFGEEDAASALA